ncbi:MAG TPA: protein-export chaperone SecB [Williamwhitmania sp.]|jgi:preprotein translocase subunit SecB|nr:protein-export chaperone SecB [Williamwhitmania sp.]
MSKPNNASFSFLGYTIQESHIKVSGPELNSVTVTFKPKGIILPKLNQFHLELEINLTESKGNFKIRIKSLGMFEFPKEANIEEYKNSYFVTNAPAILFPYIRAYISSLTALSGIQTVTIPTFNLTPLKADLLKNIVVVEQNIL